MGGELGIEICGMVMRRWLLCSVKSSRMAVGVAQQKRGESWAVIWFAVFTIRGRIGRGHAKMKDSS